MRTSFLLFFLWCSHSQTVFALTDTWDGSVKRFLAANAIFIAQPSETGLESTYELCKGIVEDQGSPDWSQHRDLKLKYVLGLVVQLRKLQDPRFDWGKGKPLSYPKIPQDVRDAGVLIDQDPAAIKDPTVRKHYEAWILARSAVVTLNSLQLRLRVVENSCRGYANQFILGRYPKSDPNNQVVWEGIARDILKDDPKIDSTLAELGKY